MARLIGYALLLIAFVTLAVWGISQFVQPILPAGINGGLVLLVAALAGVVGFFSAFKDSIELLQMVAQARDQRFLNESLGRTVFDRATIERATRNYIRPKCSNIDPAQEQEMRHALIATREDLFAKIDYFLDEDQASRHLLILADSGTGKTSFVLNYYAYNARRSGKKRHKLVIVPLGIRDVDEILKSIKQPDETVIFLDALDEDTKAMNDHRERILDLMALCSRFNRVVITCRTQFFPKDEEIPVETGIARIGPRKAGEKGAYEFVKLYLSPLDDADVKRYIWRRYPFWARRERQKAYKFALKIPLLTVRPMLLAHIPDIVAAGVEIKHSHQLYEAMVDAWLERESSWIDKEALREFSEHLAVDLYLNRATRGMERVSREQLSSMAQRWGVPLETWQIGGRSLLNRDAEGNYKFAHRSIMEYMFVLRLRRGDKECEWVALTDQMKDFLLEMLFGSHLALPKLSRALLSLAWDARTVSGEAEVARARSDSSVIKLFLDLLHKMAGSRQMQLGVSPNLNVKEGGREISISIQPESIDLESILVYSKLFPEIKHAVLGLVAREAPIENMGAWVLLSLDDWHDSMNKLLPFRWESERSHGSIRLVPVSGRPPGEMTWILEGCGITKLLDVALLLNDHHLCPSDFQSEVTEIWLGPGGAGSSNFCMRFAPAKD